VSSSSADVAATPGTDEQGIGGTGGQGAAVVGIVVVAEVLDSPLDLVAHEKAVADRRAGAVVAFEGVVRDHDHGRGVTLLEYEGHPSAAVVLREVAGEIAADPDVYAVAVSHRVGTLAIGDVALVAAVSTAHRAAAFAACARLVDEVKARLPIWKRQVFADGTEEWVNCP
jgi:molybdopterin synthase catalytic subunit